MKSKLRNLIILSVISILAVTTISCEKELENIGVNLVDTNPFTSKKISVSATTKTINVERVPTRNAQQFLLGVYKTKEFGELKASIAVQLLPDVSSKAYQYKNTANIDSVLIDIPYQSKKDGKHSDGSPKFKIDSVFGNTENAFKINIYQLKTYLNNLNPSTPSKEEAYYSDKEFQKETTPLYSGLFRVNATDTVAYINRYLQNGKKYATDTIKVKDAKPSIKIPLNKDKIKKIFVDNASNPAFNDVEAFKKYFKGFYIEAETHSGKDAHIVSLNMANSKMTIYYSQNEDEAEGQDLNGNNVKGEKNVRVKKAYTFNFGSIKANTFKRTNGIQFSNNGKLYVQGAAGSMATINLFVNENIEEIRKKNWLINNASLTFYIDEKNSPKQMPKQLYLYNLDNNEHLLDIFTEGSKVFDGVKRQQKISGTTQTENYYRFNITDYISELLKTNSKEKLHTLALKTFHSTDVYTKKSKDKKVPNLSWSPKGVVLYGAEDSFGDKKVKLEISYTKIN